MDQYNYVAPYGDKWIVVTNGQSQGTYASQQEAEQIFNYLNGGPALYDQTPAPNVTPVTADNSWQKLWEALTGTNQQQFDWDKEQYNRTLEEQKRQFDLQQELLRLQAEEAKRQFNNQQYSNLATSLLNTASSLRGPADWLTYAKNTSGGKNIFDSLFGADPNPAYGTTGFSPAITINDVLAALGLTTGQTTPVQPQTSDQMPNVPNPWQINPLVWNSMSDTDKQMIMGSVQQGNTPSGAWTWEDFINQMNAAAPKGTAPKSVRTTFGSADSIF